MSHRHEQLESTLKRAVQKALAEGIADPRTEGTMITVTGFSITRDLKTATAMVSIFPEDRAKLAMHALRHAAAHIRHQAADMVAMRTLPQLVFEHDTSIKKYAEVLQALRRVEEERQARPSEQFPEEDRGGNNPPEATTA